MALLLRLAGARKVVEVGTLAGYSALVMARALPADGHLWTIEFDPKHARVARENLAAAGLGATGHGPRGRGPRRPPDARAARPLRRRLRRRRQAQLRRLRPLGGEERPEGRPPDRRQRVPVRTAPRGFRGGRGDAPLPRGGRAKPLTRCAFRRWTDCWSAFAADPSAPGGFKRIGIRSCTGALHSNSYDERLERPLQLEDFVDRRRHPDDPARAPHPHRLGRGRAAEARRGARRARHAPARQRDRAPHDARQGAVRRAGARAALPPHGLLHRGQRARRRAGGPGGLPARLPVRDPDRSSRRAASESTSLSSR